jgi:hypothetical protein
MVSFTHRPLYPQEQIPPYPWEGRPGKPQSWPVLGAEEKIRGSIQKFPDWVDKEIYAYNNKHKGLWRQNSLDWLTK